MDTDKDYYAILGVLPSIDDVALAAVYRALLKKYHPDVFGSSKAEAEKRTREIVGAYQVLGNAEKRKAYDNARKNNGFGSYREEEQTTLVPRMKLMLIGKWSKSITPTLKNYA